MLPHTFTLPLSLFLSDFLFVCFCSCCFKPPELLSLPSHPASLLLPVCLPFPWENFSELLTCIIVVGEDFASSPASLSDPVFVRCQSQMGFHFRPTPTLVWGPSGTGGAEGVGKQSWRLPECSRICPAGAVNDLVSIPGC